MHALKAHPCVYKQNPPDQKLGGNQIMCRGLASRDLYIYIYIGPARAATT